MVDYKKREYETEPAYIYRICESKDEIGTWADVGDLLNMELGHDWTESAYRKRFQMFSEIFEAKQDDIIGSDKYIQELDEAKRELQRERIKFQTEKIEYNRQLRQDSRFEMFYEKVAEEIKTLEPPKFNIRQIPNRRTQDNEFVLTIADIHAGANFETDTNLYSLDECRKRFEILLAETISYVKERKIGSLNVLCLGDCLQGILRVSDLKLNECSVVEATVFVSRLIAEFLNKLSQYVDINYYHVPSANHSQTRPLGTKANELATEDVEYVIGNYIKDLLVNNEKINIHLNFGHEYIELSPAGIKCIAMHGHQIKNVEDSLKDISFKAQKFFSVIFLAHFHAGKGVVVGEGFAGAHDTEVLVCPSFVGTCPYADSLLKGAKAACMIYEFNKDFAHIGNYKIILN